MKSDGTSMKILMVCLGNICRSPLAEGIMAEKLKGHGTYFEIDSAGMISYHAGHPPDERSVETALRHGIDITSQRARKFERGDFEKFDLIFAMDREVYDELLTYSNSKEHRDKVYELLPYAGYEADRYVPDPYYEGQDHFEAVYGLLDDACTRIARKLT